MILWLGLAITLSLVVSGYLIYVLLSAKDAQDLDTKAQRFYAYEQQLAEIRQNTAAPAQQQLQQEAANLLFIEMQQLNSAAAPSKQQSNWFFLLICCLPLLAIASYFYLGEYTAIDYDKPALNTTEETPSAQYAEVINNLIQKIKQQPDNLNLRLILAKSYYTTDQYPEAVIQYKRVRSLIEQDSAELVNFAFSLYMAQGNFSQAIEKLLKQALTIDAQNTQALYLLGSLYYEKAQFKLALQYWRHALSILPEDSPYAQEIKQQLAVLKQHLTATP